MTSGTTQVERLLRQERAIVLLCLAAITALSWWWIIAGAGTGMSTLAMTTFEFPPPLMPPVIVDWTPAYAIVMILMWWIMMIAMMTPSAAPVILLYARAYRYEAQRGRLAPGVPSLVFTSGYLLVWGMFAALATALQWMLEQMGALHAMLMWSLEPLLSAGLLLAAGVYQLTPFKMACLKECRSPAGFISRTFRPGRLGALRMGILHGATCVGCCWALMALLFAGGLMNLLWIAGLALYVLIEKTLVRGEALARGAGILLIGLGLSVLLTHVRG